ncbi:MAG: Dabb family protein, partial [Bacteroidota bacterium]
DTIPRLVHMVFLTLQPDTDRPAFINQLKTLTAIDEVRDFQVGPYQNLGDPRALQQYDLVMQMQFADTLAYQVYQQHPVHLQLKDIIKPSLAGPPATYDFFEK